MDLTRVCTTTSPPTIVESADFPIYRFTTFRPRLTFFQPYPNNDDGLDITGMTIEMHLVDSEEVSVLDLESGIVTINGSTINVIDATNGNFEVLITDEETTTFEVGKVFWWITLNPGNGDKLLKAKGIMDIKNPY